MVFAVDPPAAPTVSGLLIAALALWRIEGLTAWQLLVVPFFFAFGNAVEWHVHRGLLHRRVRWLEVFYTRHTPQHHAVFVAADMAIREPRELRLILLPAYALITIVVLTSPATVALAWIGQPNVAALWVATVASYVLSYEWLHLAFHLPEGAHRPEPRIARLRRHHELHHATNLMHRWNFNVTLPLWDPSVGPAIARVPSRLLQPPSGAPPDTSAPVADPLTGGCMSGTRPPDPHRLEAQDSALSRPQPGFESPWGQAAPFAPPRPGPRALRARGLLVRFLRLLRALLSGPSLASSSRAPGFRRRSPSGRRYGAARPARRVVSRPPAHPLGRDDRLADRAADARTAPREEPPPGGRHVRGRRRRPRALHALRGSPGALIAGLTIWTGLCAGAGALVRPARGYGFALAGYTAVLLMLLPASGPTASANTTLVDRLLCTLLGVLSSTLVTALFTPRARQDDLDARLRRLAGDVFAFASEARTAFSTAGGLARQRDLVAEDRTGRGPDRPGDLGFVTTHGRRRQVRRTLRALLLLVVDSRLAGERPPATAAGARPGDEPIPGRSPPP